MAMFPSLRLAAAVAVATAAAASASNLPPPPTRVGDAVARLFFWFDEDHDGVFSADEMCVLARSRLSVPHAVVRLPGTGPVGQNI
jgi:hypothetical protein